MKLIKTFAKGGQECLLSLIADAIACIDKKNGENAAELSKELGNIISRKIADANRYTSVWNLFLNMFAIELSPVAHNYLIPTSDDIQKLVEDNIENFAIDISELLPKEILEIGRSYVSCDFGTIRNPFYDLIQLKRSLKKLQEKLALAADGDSVELETDELEILASANAMRNND